MSENALKPWIKKYLKSIPVIPYYHNAAKAIIAEEHFDKVELSVIIASDPGLSSQLFNQINSKRKSSKREYLESVQSALSLMGDPAIINFIEQQTTLDDVRTSFASVDDYLQLVARSHQAAKHSKLWASNRKSHGIKEVGIATKLTNIAEYALCLFDHDNFKTYKSKCLESYAPNQHSNAIWGFEIDQLALQICELWYLPELVSEVHQQHLVAGIRSQGIKIANDITHLADIGWYHTEMTDCIKKAAELCQLPLSQMSSLIHITSVESAQELAFSVKFHSAANLAQYPAKEGDKSAPVITAKPIKAKPAITKAAEEKPQKAVIKPAPAPVAAPKPVSVKPVAVEKPSSSQNSVALDLQLLIQLKAIANSSKTSQATQLKALLDGCKQHLSISRSALFLLNQDHSQIGTRLHSGVEANSPLLKFNLPVLQSGLLKIILEKPQAIWVNPENFRKYEKLLPGLFKSCSMSEDFFMMSLFSGKKVLGIVFCDNQSQAQALNKEQFNLFKQAVGLTSKAMLLIAKRNKAASAAKTTA